MGAPIHVQGLARGLIRAVLMTTLLTSRIAAQAANPGTFEVDALFPHNATTYTPQALMPLVFAVQAPSLAVSWGATIMWALWEGQNASSPGSLTNGLIELSNMNLSGSEPYMATRFFNTMAYPDGVWTLIWTIEVLNCTQDQRQPQVVQYNNATVFTTSSKSGQNPDLVAATSADMCGTAAGYAFSAPSFGDSCGFLNSSTVANPCAAPINSTGASSIFAAATAAACSPLQRPANLNVTCPPWNPGPKPSAASASASGRALVVGTSALLALLVLNHVG
ncbi:Hypothetical protein R9X50_00087900 [Acrodontium crateriforme]|uniref:DUF7136 domain-containing protein n=1 Tax=Acrodontium crateriforme TaxID=150365 RepID=A0AAQ3R5A6_9PEZI|nr:Hypothetical protein R9X50_00087900 [Acrodontium crateriforme]